VPTIDLIIAADCPNVSQARANLSAACSAAGVVPRWLEWEVADAVTPEEFRGFGSPTILVDGRDVDASGEEAAAAGHCRVYRGPAGLTGVPPIPLIAAALRRSAPPQAPSAPLRRGGLQGIAVLPSLGLAMVPVGLCPVCFAGYVGVFGALGLGFLLDARVLLPVTLLAFAIALAALAWRARSRHGLRPVLLGGAGAALVTVGQFVLGAPTAVWLGATALAAAAVWNAWPVPGGTRCADCVPAGQERAT
jgi:hypothetical protein